MKRQARGGGHEGPKGIDDLDPAELRTYILDMTANLADLAAAIPDPLLARSLHGVIARFGRDGDGRDGLGG